MSEQETLVNYWLFLNNHVFNDYPNYVIGEDVNGKLLSASNESRNFMVNRNGSSMPNIFSKVYGDDLCKRKR